MRQGNEVSLGAGSWWPEASVPVGEVTAVRQATPGSLGGIEEAEGSVAEENWGLNKYLQGTGK